VIHAFGAHAGDAFFPTTGVVIDGEGNLYGVAGGGANNEGSIYEFSPGAGGTWSENILYSFTGIYDGAGPDALIRDKNGDLYGAASSGGRRGITCYEACGTIFRLVRESSGSWQFGQIYRLDITNGSQPNGLVIDSSGNLYGTTNSGGSASQGVAFELQRPSSGDPGNPWTYSFSLLYNFGASSDGIEPQGLIMQGGRLFGTTLSTTTCSLCGTVWEITP